MHDDDRLLLLQQQGEGFWDERERENFAARGVPSISRFLTLLLQRRLGLLLTIMAHTTIANVYMVTYRCYYKDSLVTTGAI